MKEATHSVGARGEAVVLAPTVFAEAGSTLESAAVRVVKSSPPGYRRIEAPILPDTSGIADGSPSALLSWLAANANQRRVFWSGRETKPATGGVFAGVGVAELVTDEVDGVHGLSRNGSNGVARGLVVVEDLRKRLAGIPPGMRYYGGLRFDLGMQVSDEWSSFGRFCFQLPRFEVGTSASGCSAVLNVTPRDWEKPDRISASCASTRFALAETGNVTTPVFRDNHPDIAGWRHNVNWSLDRFSSSRLAKVVLARRATLGFDRRVPPTGLLEQLVASTSNCYHFMFAVGADVAFVGASPERLFKLKGRKVWSEAVAGTRRRGATEGADEELCKELLLSEKDQREHVYVRQSIKETLSGLCAELHVDASASEMRLRRGRHLVSRVEGLAAEGVTAADFLLGLHPTPAVGGYPTVDAMRAIARLEGFDRGWYAAPVGWIGRDEAEFAVAIRSGLVEGKQVSLYSGAGIVGGSTPESEWAEIEDKLADFVSVFDSSD